jgi:hypothetical protein
MNFQNRGSQKKSCRSNGKLRRPKMRVGTAWRAGAAAAAVAVLLSATPVSTFSPGIAFPGIARASSPALALPLRPMSGIRMQAGKEGKGGGGGRLLSAAAGAAMAASIVFGPVAPVQQAVAFRDVATSPSLLDNSAIHLARKSWLEENESIDELVHAGLSGKDKEERPIADKKVLSSFLPLHHEEESEPITPRSLVLTPPTSLPPHQPHHAPPPPT